MLFPETVGQTFQKEHPGSPGKSEEHHQEKPRARCRETHHPTEPHHSRMGTVSSACRERENLQNSRRRYLSQAEAMGQTETSEEIQRMDREEILHDQQRAYLRLLSTNIPQQPPPHEPQP